MNFWTHLFRVYKASSARVTHSQNHDKKSQTLISSGDVVRGSLHTEGDVLVAGTLIGDITCDKLIVAKGGTVQGDVSAREYECCDNYEKHSDGVEITHVLGAIGNRSRSDEVQLQIPLASCIAS
jgi:hypothetical protein